MKNIYLALKVLVNLLLFGVYSLIAIIFGNFLFGLFVKYVLSKDVPNANDSSHFKIAIFIFILTAVLTIIYRKYLYLSLNVKDKEEEDLEIYVNKEIKK